MKNLGLFGFSATLTYGWVGSMTDSWVYLTVKILLDLLGSLLGGGKGHVQVTMIWDIWNPTHLLRARQGHGLHPGIPGRPEALKNTR